MKKILFLLAFLVYHSKGAVIIPNKIQKVIKEEKPIEKPKIHSVTGTVYNSVASQTDFTPDITASGYKLTKKDYWRTIAISKDLLRDFKYGDTVYVSGKGFKRKGLYIVRDCTNPRLRNHIDFFVNKTIKMGKWQLKIQKN